VDRLRYAPPRADVEASVVHHVGEDGHSADSLSGLICGPWTALRRWHAFLLIGVLRSDTAIGHLLRDPKPQFAVSRDEGHVIDG